MSTGRTTKYAPVLNSFTGTRRNQEEGKTFLLLLRCASFVVSGRLLRSPLRKLESVAVTWLTAEAASGVSVVVAAAGETLCAPASSPSSSTTCRSLRRSAGSSALSDWPGPLVYGGGGGRGVRPGGGSSSGDPLRRCDGHKGSSCPGRSLRLGPRRRGEREDSVLLLPRRESERGRKEGAGWAGADI